MQAINKISVFTSHKSKHPIYRIPGIVVSTNDVIITYCEGRMAVSDWSTKSIVMKRSLDGGQTFEDEQVIASSPTGEAVNNPVMIASKDGTIHFLWQILYRRTFYQKSTDDGKTFTKPIEITSIFDSYKDIGLNWNVYALGPGHGIEMSNNTLVIPVWIATGHGDDHGPACVSTIYSKDNGVTWKTGEVVAYDDNCPNMNETTCAELSDKSLMLNIRNHSPIYRRAISISKTGYSNFSPYTLDHTLSDPICFGSIASGKLDSKDVIAFVNCANYPNVNNFYNRERKNLTLRLSYDDAKTWAFSREIELRAGYSDIAFSNDQQWIYCFYEHDVEDIYKSEPRHLTLAKVNLDWITQS